MLGSIFFQGGGSVEDFPSAPSLLLLLLFLLLLLLFPLLLVVPSLASAFLLHLLVLNLLVDDGDLFRQLGLSTP